MVVQDPGSVQSDVRLVIGICIDIADCCGTRFEVVDQAFSEKRVIGQVDQMGHLLWSVQADETFLNTNTKIFESLFTFLMNLLRLQQLLLPCLVQIRKQLLTLTQLLRDLCLGDLFQGSICARDADHLLIQRSPFGIGLASNYSSSAWNTGATSEFAPQ
ncbi:hypothetical protein HG530_013434 [Fusarium avenaceum]|nr:hypothetical protein HG530_013434 [Fusarium avenaceum]